MSEFFYREDTALIQLTATDGTGAVIFSGEQCYSIEGGDSEFATEHVHPGNMEDPEAIGGIETPADITVEMRYTDLTCVYVPAVKAAGSGCSLVATVTPKNAAKELNDAGKLEGTGVLKSCKPPKRDAAASGKAMITIVFTPNGGGLS